MTETTPEVETANDIALSLTGYDEVAIAKFFGAEYTDLVERPMTFLRALMFTVERRNGAKDAEAYKAAMSATTRELTAYFPDEPDEDSDEADELGKDE